MKRYYLKNSEWIFCFRIMDPSTSSNRLQSWKYDGGKWNYAKPSEGVSMNELRTAWRGLINFYNCSRIDQPTDLDLPYDREGLIF